MKSELNVLFLGPYPKKLGPSQRFRLEIYLPALKDLKINWEYKTFYSEKSYSKLYQKGKYFSKVLSVLSGFLRRFYLIFSLHKYNVIFVQREITPIGPAFFEWLISKVFRKKLVYDFDDAIWLPNFSEENASFHRLKNYGKVNRIIKWSHTVIAGNEFLASHAKKINENTIVIPTIVDTNNNHNPDLYEKTATDKLTIGWTGTLTTNLHIEFLTPVFEKLNKLYEYDIFLISNKEPAVDLPNVKFLKWDKENEIQQLMRIDIGLMPLKSNFDFYRGKCGFKAIQYMALGITTVATPVGVNKQIIDNEKSGYFASNHQEWFQVLESILQSNNNSNEMNLLARKNIEEKYSLTANFSSFIAALKGF